MKQGDLSKFSGPKFYIGGQNEEKAITYTVG